MKILTSNDLREPGHYLQLSEFVFLFLPFRFSFFVENTEREIFCSFYFSFENQCISDEDKKILRLMALRREAAIEEEEMAFSARNVWAQDKQLHTKV